MKKKPYTIHHWDTFDNEIIKIGEVRTLKDAIKFVKDRYSDRIRATGADQVDIVFEGRIVEKFKVG